MERIIKAVSESTGVSVEDIKSRKRDGRTCEARQIFIYLSRKVNKESIYSMCSYLHRTHQTVSHNLRIIRGELKIYKGMNKKVGDIEKIIIV